MDRRGFRGFRLIRRPCLEGLSPVPLLVSTQPLDCRAVTAGGSFEAMKKEIHPEYYVTEVKCGCGDSFTTRSTRNELKVDICSACHPFYTGKLKFIDTAGRIEKFKNKFAGAGYASLKGGKKAKAATEASE
jgi:large subunit ribosomal protein L31